MNQDARADGAKSVGDTGVSNVMVFLDADNSGRRNGSELWTPTDSLGRYAFADVPAGTYTVRVSHNESDRWTQTAPFAPQANGAVGHQITVAPRQQHSDVEFGMFERSVISGRVYEDTNGNGQQDSGKRGVQRRIVYADMNSNQMRDADEPAANTDAQGNYHIEGVAPGPMSLAHPTLGSVKIVFAM